MNPNDHCEQATQHLNVLFPKASVRNARLLSDEDPHRLTHEVLARAIYHLAQAIKHLDFQLQSQINAPPPFQPTRTDADAHRTHPSTTHPH